MTTATGYYENVTRYTSSPHDDHVARYLFHRLEPALLCLGHGPLQRVRNMYTYRCLSCGGSASVIANFMGDIYLAGYALDKPCDS